MGRLVVESPCVKHNLLSNFIELFDSYHQTTGKKNVITALVMCYILTIWLSEKTKEEAISPHVALITL